MKHLVFPFIFVLALTGCSKGGPSPQGLPLAHERKEPQLDRDMGVKGQFMAPLGAVNQIVVGDVHGAATLSLEENEFVGDVNFSGGALTAAVLHSQGVYTGTRCPTLEDDLNDDGFIDVKEGESVYGKLLIPLDGNLNSQYLELGTYPASDAFGGYIYSELASFEKLMADLKDSDINPDDSLVKLRQDEPLQFSGKVVVIQGVAQAAQLPESVATTSRAPNFQTLPISCGIFRKVTEIPGTVDRDESRDPDREGSAGGVAGSDDGTIIIPPVVGGGGNTGTAGSPL